MHGKEKTPLQIRIIKSHTTIRWISCTSLPDNYLVNLGFSVEHHILSFRIHVERCLHISIPVFSPSTPFMVSPSVKGTFRHKKNAWGEPKSKVLIERPQTSKSSWILSASCFAKKQANNCFNRKIRARGVLHHLGTSTAKKFRTLLFIMLKISTSLRKWQLLNLLGRLACLPGVSVRRIRPAEGCGESEDYVLLIVGYCRQVRNLQGL